MEPASWSQAASRASSQPLLIKPLCALGGGARPAGASSHLEASTGLGQPSRLTAAPPRATRPALGKHACAHPAAHLSPTRLPFFSDPSRGHHEHSSWRRAERALTSRLGLNLNPGAGRCRGGCGKVPTVCQALNSFQAHCCPGSEYRWLRVCGLELEDLGSNSSSSCVALSKALNLSEPQFPPLSSGDNNSPSPSRLSKY